MATAPPLHRLDAQIYAQIVGSGALEGQRVELIDGLLVDMSPQDPPHAVPIQRLTRHLIGAHDLLLRVQLPLEVAEHSVPEPDLALVAGPEDVRAHPRTARLVVEISVSSRAFDRGRKAELYAAAGVDEYWVVDVPDGAVEVRTEPTPGGYGRVATYRMGDVVPSPAAGVADLPVAALLAGLASEA